MPSWRVARMLLEAGERGLALTRRRNWLRLWRRQSPRARTASCPRSRSPPCAKSWRRFGVMAAESGIYVSEPPLAKVIEVCEDLATRNRRRGYAALVTLGPLASCLYDSYTPSGRDFGYTSERQYLSALQEALPAGNWQRLSALQNPDGELAATRLDALRAADIHYHS